MGRVMVRARLTNYDDVVRQQLGSIAGDQVRSVEMDGLVDTGATMLVLPDAVVRELGLTIAREVTVTYADGRREKRGIARGIILEIQGREAEVEAIVEATAPRILIGQVPLAVMDLVVDPKNQTLGPRPESPDSPLIEVF
jgi:clan AA aspartic protease